MNLSLPVPTSGIPLGVILRRLHALLRGAVPVGYEDQTGFHTGLPPANPEMAVLSLGVFPPPADQPHYPA